VSDAPLGGYCAELTAMLLLGQEADGVEAAGESGQRQRRDPNLLSTAAL